MTKASEIKPTSWRFGESNLRTGMLMRKWRGINKNVLHMEGTLLELMQNPQTTTEQLSQAATLYADMTKHLYEAARSIDEYIYFGRKPDKHEFHMLSCATRKTGNEDDCDGKDWEGEE